MSAMSNARFRLTGGKGMRVTKIGLWLLVVWSSAVLLLALTSVLFWYLCSKPELIKYQPYSRAYFDQHEQLLRLTLAQDQRYRLFTAIEQIDEQFIQATLLYEDQHYYEHYGVDVTALVRAFWQTYILGSRKIGASTITMQVARLRWQIPTRNLAGKLTQIVRALQLSRHYSKQEILQAYLNLAPYGRNIEGIGAASLIYFKKQAKDLSLVEALTLAVIPQNPNKRSPSHQQGLQNALAARERLLARWLEQNPADQPQQKFFQLPLKVHAPEELPFWAPHFVDYLQQQQSRWQAGIVTTSLDLALQRALEKRISQYTAINKDVGINNAAALVVEYKTRQIKAMVGSSDFFNNTIAGQVNGTHAKRSPGSTLKPFVYALGFDQGAIHPHSLMRDAPKQFAGFTPENFDQRFLGPISAKTALITSRNVPAVNLQAQLEHQAFYKLLQTAGVSQLKPAEHYGLALALGGGELTAIELAELYATLANGGLFAPVTGFSPAANNDSTHINPFASNADKRLLSQEASFLTLDILKDNPAPDRSQLAIARKVNQVAWKTGTSWAFRDAWSVGISGPYVLVVWVGNFDGSSNPAFVGRTAAAPLFFDIWQSILPNQGWQVSDLFNLKVLNLKRLQLCADTGDLYHALCPNKSEGWFIPGVSPIKLSNIYRQIPIDTKTGKRACGHTPGITQLQTYAFWPSDFVEIFNRAGISLKAAPSLSEHCNTNGQHSWGTSAGVKPHITSPQAEVSYLAGSLSQVHPIAFKARTDADVAQLHWFIDDQYLGSKPAKETLFWQATAGNYTVTVIDDAGRSSTQSLSVIARSL